MEKILAMNVAAQLTSAACGGGGNIPISPDLSDPNVRAKNLQVWETFRAFYRGVVAASDDNTNWPTPKISTGTVLPDVLKTGITAALPAISAALPAIGPLLSSGPIADLIGKFLAAVPSTPAPIKLPPNLPDPGATPAK